MRVINQNGKIKQKDIIQFFVGFIFVLIIAYASEEFIPGRLAVQKIFFGFLALFGIVCWLYKNIDLVRGKYWGVLGLFSVPFFLTSLYTMVISVLCGDNMGTTKQSFTTAMFLLIDLFVVIALSSYFDTRIIVLFSASLIGAYLYAILMETLDSGISDTVKKLLSMGIERNDIGVAVVPLILCFFYVRFIGGKRINYIFPLILLGVMFFCGKRSAVLSLAIGVMLIVIVKYSGDFSVLLMKICAVFTIIGCWLYVIGIRYGVFSSLMQGKGTLSDRYYVWKHFDYLYDVWPLYFGKGFGFIHRYMASGLGDWMVNAYGYLHNSILQLFIETGFWGFCFWLGIYLIGIPYLARKRYGKSAFCFTVISVVSMFAMFTVDNTLTYPLYQVCLMCSLYTVYRLEEMEPNGKKR